MEEENVTVTVPNCSNADVAATQIIEEGPRICPLCSAEVRLFFINFSEKMLMCENTECEFPFGYEDLQFVSYDGGEATEVYTVKTKSRLSPTPTGSVISTAAWSEIDKINRESEETQDRFYEDFEAQKKAKKNSNENVEKIRQSVEEIRKLNKKITELSEDKKIIKNKKWIKNLLYFQGVSGTQLLKPQELDQLKSTNADSSLGGSELKINIEPGTNNTMSSITIDIADKNK